MTDRPEASLRYAIKPGSIPFISSISALLRRYEMVRLLGFPLLSFLNAGLANDNFIYTATPPK